MGQTHTNTHLYTQDVFFGQRTLPAHSLEHSWVAGCRCGEKAKSAATGPVQFVFSVQHKKSQGAQPPSLASWPPMEGASKCSNLPRVFNGLSNRGGLVWAFCLFMVSSAAGPVYTGSLQVRLWAEPKTLSPADFPQPLSDSFISPSLTPQHVPAGCPTPQNMLLFSLTL